MLAQVGEFSFVLERAGREVGLSPAGLAATGSQTFIAATVVLMVLTPLLMQVGSRLSRRLETKQAGREAAQIAAQPLPEHLPQLEDHVIVAGYGEAARRLVRVLSGSGIPYIITTLSPAGANEAEAEGLIVLRGDASHQRTLQLAGVERAKMVVIADDDPATARRIASVARTTNPTMRILVRTRYIAEIESFTEAGVDRVIAEELESVVGLFADVLRDYRIAAEEIDAHEEAMRRGGYVALLRDPVEGEASVVECDLPEDCLDTRTVTIRAGASVTSQPFAALALEDSYGIALRTLRRDGEVIGELSEDFTLRAGDELVLHGTADAFARSAPLFRSQTGTVMEFDSAPSTQSDIGNNGGIDTGQVIELNPAPAALSSCAHLEMARAVRPRARGCEECLQTGDTWVHLRLCMTCGHVGCCDSSKNKHASKHYPATEHPIIKSLERGEDWAWCYPDATYL
jgi:CPA2 family monovalent cation:H+ antiporter-2